MLELSLYLVTGRDLLPDGKDYYASLEESILGGVTIVQIREKTISGVTTDGAEFLKIAQRSKAICTKYNVPMIVNDRLDIAMLVGAEGVHLGQSDIGLVQARKLLGPDSIIGISVHTAEQAVKAKEGGADYIGIGPVWSTNTKQINRETLGISGVKTILDALENTSLQAVAIGGITSYNIGRLLHGAKSRNAGRSLDGVAIVSEIAASRNPREVAGNLRDIVTTFKSLNQQPKSIHSPLSILSGASELLSSLKRTTPLIHQITNNVVINQSANTTLALGASPIMATAEREMVDLSQVIHALLINFGTITDKAGMLAAGRNANLNRKPIVFDPVAVGATEYRRITARELLDSFQVSIIKGNAAEIGTLADSQEVTTRGVDSVGAGFMDPASIVRSLAKEQGAVVVMTGKCDWISDGELTFQLSNGHEMLANITGSGCMVGTSIAVFCGAAGLTADDRTSNVVQREGLLARGDLLVAAIAGILSVTIASELAAQRDDVRGPGTFLPALLDELYNLNPDTLKARANIVQH